MTQDSGFEPPFLSGFGPERRIEMGPEPEGSLFFGDFITETGRLSGSNLTDIAQQAPFDALALLTDFAISLPSEDQPRNQAALLGLVEWSDEAEKKTFLRLIRQQEPTE